MFPTEIKIGYILRYSYLWHDQHLKGRQDGDKDRPCLVLALIKFNEDGSPVVRVLPITHSPPTNQYEAIEIPQTVKNRLRLDDERSWIILTESNRFTWPGPDVRPLGTETGYYGPLPPALFSDVKKRFLTIARDAQHKVVPRST